MLVIVMCQLKNRPRGAGQIHSLYLAIAKVKIDIDWSASSKRLINEGNVTIRHTCCLMLKSCMITSFLKKNPHYHTFKLKSTRWGVRRILQRITLWSKIIQFFGLFLFLLWREVKKYILFKTKLLSKPHDFSRTNGIDGPCTVNNSNISAPHLVPLLFCDTPFTYAAGMWQA